MLVMVEKLLALNLLTWLAHGRFTDGVDGRTGLLQRDVDVLEKPIIKIEY
jgi:hypothetical protein